VNWPVVFDPRSYDFLVKELQSLGQEGQAAREAEGPIWINSGLWTRSLGLHYKIVSHHGCMKLANLLQSPKVSFSVPWFHQGLSNVCL